MNLNPVDESRGGVRPLPMTSMIDVVFLLLIFFMVTSNFMEDEQRLSSTLQAEGRGAAQSDLQPQIVDVKLRNGQPVYAIGANVAENRRQLAAVLSTLSRAQGVIIRGHDEVPIDAIAEAMQAAEDAAFEKRTYVPASR